MSDVSEKKDKGPGEDEVVGQTLAERMAEYMRRSILWPAACLLLGAVAATVATWYLMRPTPMSLSRFPISLPQNQMPNEYFSDIALSPDGKRLVYVGGLGGTTQLFLREIDQIESRELPETKGAVRPFFSPDGQSIGFLAGGKLKTLFLDGGRPQTLCDAARLPGASWRADGTIFFTRTWDAGISRISTDGRVPKTITTPDAEAGEYGHWWPEVLPGGGAVLFTIWKTTLNDACVAVLSLRTGKYQKLVAGATHARYAPTGHLLYAQSGCLVAAPFNLKRLKLGEPRPVLEGLKQSPFTGYAPFCFSRDGLLYYIRGGEWLARRRLVWVNRQGEEVESVPLAPGAYSQPRLSPDGYRVAFTKFERDALNIWVYDLASDRATQRTFESNNFLALWRPNGTELTFTTYRRGPFSVYCMPADGVGTEDPLVTGTYDRQACSWSPDGKTLLFVETDPSTNGDIWLFSTEDANAPRALLRESWDERQAVFSPDGDWIAYVSDEGGGPDLYVAPYPGPGEIEKISTDGGYQPVWSRDGKELFYRSGNEMMAATIETGPGLSVTGSKVLFEGHYLTGYHRNYDVSSDGQRFLMIKEAEGQPAATQLAVVLNWFEELKRLVPTGDI